MLSIPIFKCNKPLREVHELFVGTEAERPQCGPAQLEWEESLHELHRVVALAPEVALREQHVT
jgi:hypothetical protein